MNCFVTQNVNCYELFMFLLFLFQFIWRYYILIFNVYMITLFWTHEYIDPIQVNIRVLLKKKQGKTARSPRAAANHRASGAGWWICWKWLKRLQFDISEQGDMNGKEREQHVTIHELIYWNYKLNAVWPQFIVDSLCLFFGCGQLQIISRYSCWGDCYIYCIYIYIHLCSD